MGDTTFIKLNLKFSIDGPLPGARKKVVVNAITFESPQPEMTRCSGLVSKQSLKPGKILQMEKQHVLLETKFLKMLVLKHFPISYNVIFLRNEYFGMSIQHGASKTVHIL